MAAGSTWGTRFVLPAALTRLNAARGAIRDRRERDLRSAAKAQDARAVLHQLLQSAQVAGGAQVPSTQR
jgi:hypothetical protein